MRPAPAPLSDLEARWLDRPRVTLYNGSSWLAPLPTADQRVPGGLHVDEDE